MTKTVVTLQDRYSQLSGRVFLSSMQALVRLPVDQARRDRAAGLNTGGYVSGYRGSPITTLDAQLWASKKLLDEYHIHFEPGLNEELAATSLRGTQQLDWFGKSKFEGVFAMWYAKGLGVDRACEALKLANFEGTSAKGGVLVVAGDDHAAKSSASAHQSEHTLMVGFIPILAPSTTDEILEYGQIGWEMSRFSGLYVGMKTVTDMLDLTTSVQLPELSFRRPILPGNPMLNLRRSLPALAQESLVLNERLPAALAFARENNLNRMVVAAERPVLTIVTAGKPYLDVSQALRDLDLDEAACRRLGISVVKLGLTWPLDADFIRAACSGAKAVMVVEEKRPVIEDQVINALYTLQGERPTVIGKRDANGHILFPLDNVIDPILVRNGILRQLEAMGLLDDITRIRAGVLEAIANAPLKPPAAIRPAYFCSGCPHNTSTNVPDGSFALGATGCHGLAAFMPERRTMNVVGMGAEGLAWVGAQHFTETRHVFANMGDGTYTHSGILAIRAALSAKANVTFKILYNDAVAMTGGQPMEGNISVPMIAQELLAEGVKPVVLLSDDPESHKDIPAGIRILHRDHLEEISKELREVPGVTAILYVQTCANEKRRRRKRGDYPDPDLRLYINPAVCEGCGDCSVQSNCMSVTPLETEFGRKRMIDQSNCNKDYSCIKGYCPSFVSVTGAKPKKRALDMTGLTPLIAALSEPQIADSAQGYSMMVTGIGGTGVLTVGAVLGMAAHMEGKAAKVLDMTGMAQKGGGVMSHVRFSDDVGNIPSARLSTGQTDLLIACDLIVATGPDVAKTLRADTKVVANEDVAPTGEFQTRPDIDLRPATFLGNIAGRVGAENISLVQAGALAGRMLGDTIFTNLMMVGYALQKGLLPVSLESIEEAVKLNGTAIKQNLQALAIGRIAAENPEALLALAKLEEGNVPRTLEEMTGSRVKRLTDYQNAAYAKQYTDFLGAIRAKLQARGIADPEPFLFQVADQLARLMAYKDEYEVARLFTDPSFREGLESQFEGDFKIKLNLASPLISWRKDPKTHRPAKVQPGSWVFPTFKLMSKLKFLRGTALDLPGYQAERRMERRLIKEYRDLITRLAEEVTEASLPKAVEIANAARVVCGYGPIKESNVETYRARLATLLPEFEAANQPVAAQALETA